MGSERKIPHDKWDLIWKFFCNTDLIHGPWFVRKLLGEPFKDYSLDTATLTMDDPEGPNPLRPRRADRYIVAKLDDTTKMFDLEFQSTFDYKMGLRCLQYGLNKCKEIHRSDPAKMLYILPECAIIDVRGSMSKLSYQSIDIRSGINKATFKFPVVHALDVFPGLKEIMTCKDSAALSDAISRFVRSIPGVPEETAEYYDLVEACATLAHPEVFIRHIEEKEVSEIVERVINDGKTINQRIYDRGEAKGREDTILAIMENLNVSREEAIRIATPKTRPASGGVSRMNL